MKTVAAIIPVMVLCGCMMAPPVAMSDFVGQAENACLPEAIILAETLHKDGIPARILIIKTAASSHAAAAFLFPADMSAVWVWDAYSQSVQIQADFDNPVDVAFEWLKATAREELVLNAAFL